MVAGEADFTNVAMTSPMENWVTGVDWQWRTLRSVLSGQTWTPKMKVLEKSTKDSCCRAGLGGTGL